MKPPRQARSRATLDRLLEATAELLAERRFEEATLAELVRRAGSSVGAFYARFESKQALLRYFDEQLFKRGRALWEEFLAPESWRGASAATIVTRVVARFVESRRRHRGLLRSLALYVRSRPAPDFAARAARLNRFVTRRLARLLLLRREQIGHRDPERAIAFGLLLLDSATREAILFEKAGLSPGRLTDRDLAAELTRALLAYLEIVPEKRGAGR